MTHAVPLYTRADLEAQSVLDVDSLTNDDAVDLGLTAVALIREWDLSLAVEVVLHDDVVFRAKLKQSNSENDPWLTGKAAVVRLFGEPSLLVKTRLLEAGTPFETLDYDHETLKAHGGSVPLRVSGQLVGTLTTSGEPDAVDHEVSAETVRRYLAARTA